MVPLVLSIAVDRIVTVTIAGTSFAENRRQDRAAARHAEAA
jgi:hypothetical protein